MYDFVDTTQQAASSSVSLVSEAISLDGEYIENHIEGYKTLTVSGRESLEYNVSDADRPTGMDGKEYYGKSMPERNLVIKFMLQANTAAAFMTQYRALKKFCSGEKRIIRFADEPNTHYTGTLINMDTPSAGMISVISEMTFYCADPYLYADDDTTVTASVENGILTAVVDNDGSAQVFPTYTITQAAENGYLGIISTEGALEIGNKEEADTTTYTRSERLVSGIGGFSNFNGTYPRNSSIVCDGTLSVGGDGNEFFTLSSKGSSTTAAHGGCKRITLPADSNGDVGAVNFYLWYQINFMTGFMGQTGIAQIILSDQDDKFVAGFGINKTDTSGNTAHVYMWTGLSSDANGGIFKEFPITPSVYDENPYNGRGVGDILKQGKALRFYYDGQYYSIDIPAIETKKVKYIYIFIGQYAGCSDYVTIMQIGKIAARKDYVSGVNNIPNRYAAGSVIKIRTENDSITVDGLPANDELVTGSTFAALPVGKTYVEFYPSSWCTANPVITVSYKKRWL